MKKLFFIAALGVAGMVSGKSPTFEFLNFEKPTKFVIMCTVNVIYYNQYGQETGRGIFTNNDSNDTKTCAAYEQGIIDGLTAAGKRFSSTRLLLRIVRGTSTD